MEIIPTDTHSLLRGRSWVEDTLAGGDASYAEVATKAANHSITNYSLHVCFFPIEILC